MPDVDKIIAYESGELSEPDTIALFQELVDSGLAWRLQGSYGRTAAALIGAGLVTAGCAQCYGCATRRRWHCRPAGKDSK
jgi:hypothetical protein